MISRLAVTLMGFTLALAALVLPPTASASDRTYFRGCVVAKTDTTITLATTANERVDVDTTWIKPAALADALTDCVTVTALTVDGRYVAESIEAGDEWAR